MSADSSNLLIDVLSFYIFADLVVMPRSCTIQDKPAHGRLNHWDLQDESEMTYALHRTLAELLPDWDMDVPSSEPEYCPVNQQWVDPTDAGIVMVEVWSDHFVVRAWANNGDGAADCLPTFQAVIPLSAGFGPIRQTLIALMRRLALGLERANGLRRG